MEEQLKEFMNMMKLSQEELKKTIEAATSKMETKLKECQASHEAATKAFHAKIDALIHTTEAITEKMEADNANFTVNEEVEGNTDVLSCHACPTDSKHCYQEGDFAIVTQDVRQIVSTCASQLDSWSNQSLQQWQSKDSDISISTPTTKRCCELWESARLRDGILYQRLDGNDDGKSSKWQVILPSSRITEVLSKLHGTGAGGHSGLLKTLQKVRERFYWDNARSDAEHWCKTCEECAALNRLLQNPVDESGVFIGKEDTCYDAKNKHPELKAKAKIFNSIHLLGLFLRLQNRWGRSATIVSWPNGVKIWIRISSMAKSRIVPEDRLSPYFEIT